jgi:hypothetical protein
MSSRNRPRKEERNRMGTCGIIDCNRNDRSNTFLHVQSTSIMYKFPIQERKGYRNYGLDDTVRSQNNGQDGAVNKI